MAVAILYSGFGLYKRSILTLLNFDRYQEFLHYRNRNRENKTFLLFFSALITIAR